MSTNWNFLSRAKNISARATFLQLLGVIWTPRSLWLHSIYTKCAYNKNAIPKNQKKNLLVSRHLIWNKMVLRVPSGHWKSLDILGFACCSPLGNVLLFFCSNGCLCKVRKSYTTAATLESLIHVSQYFLA